LQTVDNGFIRHSLPKGEMTHRGRPVDPGAIRNVGSSPSRASTTTSPAFGQTEAAHDLCTNLPADKKMHYHAAWASATTACSTASRFRAEVAPRIADFVLSVEKPKAAVRRPAAVKLVG